MEDFYIYNESFRRGMEDTRYEDEPQDVQIPAVDYSDYSSIGYYDGVIYGKYLIMTGMSYDIKEENIIAVVDKGFTHAMNNYTGAKKRK